MWAISMVVALVTIALLVVQLSPDIWEDASKGQVATLIGIGVALTVIIALLASGGAALRWTGFGGKTLWDWLQILSALAIPIVLAAAGFWFTAQQDQRQQQTEALRAESERRLEKLRAQDAALQAYLDQMSTLMLNRDLLESEKGDPVYTLAQARTSTVITRLDADHNVSVTRFLSDSGLVGTTSLGESSVSIFREIDLSGADLSGVTLTDAKLSGAFLNDAKLSDIFLTNADLSGVTLTDAKLSGAFLNDADLRGAFLYAADLRGAHLIRANLSGATLSSWADRANAISVSDEADRINVNRILDADPKVAADLSGADLRGANLSNAFLSGADLSGADLSEASLIGADLSDVDVTQEQLSDSLSLYNATMPNGQKYKDWLEGHSVFPDSDRDGLTDEKEKMLGRDPNNPDTDRDGVQDGTDDTNGDSVTDSRVGSGDGA